jgi:hypothetical protein
MKLGPQRTKGSQPMKDGFPGGCARPRVSPQEGMFARSHILLLSAYVKLDIQS